MKSITLALMVYVFVSFIFDFANAKSATLGGVTSGETNTDVSMPKNDKAKNQYSEKVCKENNYSGHFLSGLCNAYCFESTKGEATRNINLPNGISCADGKTCIDGFCGDPEERNDEFLGIVDNYLDKSEILKGLSPKFLDAIKAELRNFKPQKAGEINPYIEKLVNSYTDLAKYLPKSKQFEPTH